MPGGTCSCATHEGHSRENSWVGGAATQDDICACLDRCNVWLWSEQGYDAIAFKKSIRVCTFKRRKSFDATICSLLGNSFGFLFGIEQGYARALTQLVRDFKHDVTCPFQSFVGATCATGAYE